jgi:hypothetical protein
LREGVAPEQHIEDEEIHKSWFTASQWERIEELFECYRAINNSEATDEDIFEEIWQFWMEANQHDVRRRGNRSPP